MITIDIIIIVFLLYWAIRGFIKGLASEVISLIIWLIAIYITLNFFYIPKDFIQSYVDSPELSSIITYLFIFLFTLFVALVSGFFVSRFVNMMGLYSFNKVLGFIFGLIKGFALGLLINFFIINMQLSDSKILSDSQFIPYFNYFLDNFFKSSDSLFDSFQLKI
jgi:membrane protein required for colicin V production